MQSTRQQRCREHSTSLTGGKYSFFCDDCQDEVWIPRFPFPGNFTLDILQSDIDSGTTCSIFTCPTAIAWSRKVLVDLFGFKFDEEGNFTGLPIKWNEQVDVEVEVGPECILWKYGSDTWTILLPDNLQAFIGDFDATHPGKDVDPIHVEFTPSCITHEWEK